MRLGPKTKTTQILKKVPYLNERSFENQIDIVGEQNVRFW